MGELQEMLVWCAKAWLARSLINSLGLFVFLLKDYLLLLLGTSISVDKQIFPNKNRWLVD